MQWLRDNGPCYVSHETVSFARNLGFEECTPPAYGDLKDAISVMNQLPVWFKDYKQNAPRSQIFLQKASFSI